MSQETDQLLVNRDSTTQIVTVKQMAELQDNDLMLVNREGTTYTATGKEIKDSVQSNVAPDITSVVLTQDQVDSDRYTSNQFTSTVNYSEEPFPPAQVSMTAEVTGAFGLVAGTDEITTNNYPGTASSSVVLDLASDVNLGTAFEVGDVVKTSASYTPETDLISNASALPEAKILLTLSTEKDIKLFQVGDAVQQSTLSTNELIINWTGYSANNQSINFYLEAVYLDDKMLWDKSAPNNADPGPDYIEITNANSNASQGGQNWANGQINLAPNNKKTDSGWRPLITDPGVILTWDNAVEFQNITLLVAQGSASPVTGDASLPDGTVVADISIPIQKTEFDVVVGIPASLVEVISTDVSAKTITVDGGEWDTSNNSKVSTLYPKQGEGTISNITGSVVTIEPFTDNCFKEGQYLIHATPKTILITPKTDAITDVTGDVLTFSGSKDLLNFAPGDPVSMVNADGSAASVTGEVVSTDPQNDTMTLTNNNGEWVLGNYVQTPEKPAIAQTGYLKFSSNGNVTGVALIPQSPTAMTEANPVLTFPATFDTGASPDTELPYPTSLLTRITASNVNSNGETVSSSGVSNTLFPESTSTFLVPACCQVEYTGAGVAQLMANLQTFSGREAEANTDPTDIGSRLTSATSDINSYIAGL